MIKCYHVKLLSALLVKNFEKLTFLETTIILQIATTTTKTVKRKQKALCLRLLDVIHKP